MIKFENFGGVGSLAGCKLFSSLFLWCQRMKKECIERGLKKKSFGIMTWRATFSSFETKAQRIRTPVSLLIVCSYVTVHEIESVFIIV